MMAVHLEFPFRLLGSLRRDYNVAKRRFREACKLPADDPQNQTRFRDAAWMLAEAERRLGEVV